MRKKKPLLGNLFNMQMVSAVTLLLRLIFQDWDIFRNIHLWFIFFFTHKDTALYTNLFSIPTCLFGGWRLANNFLHEQRSVLYLADLRNVANEGICTDAYFICLQPSFFYGAHWLSQSFTTACIILTCKLTPAQNCSQEHQLSYLIVLQWWMVYFLISSQKESLRSCWACWSLPGNSPIFSFKFVCLLSSPLILCTSHLCRNFSI